MLALHEVHEHPLWSGDAQARIHRAGLERAISFFFAPVEDVLAEYGA